MTPQMNDNQIQTAPERAVIDMEEQQHNAASTGIVGIEMAEDELALRLTAYVNAWYDALETARAAAGGSLSFGAGTQTWQPEWPRDLQPDWVVSVKLDGDGSVFYIDLDGPERDGIWLTQEIAIDLEKLPAGELGIPASFTTDGLRMAVGEDEYLDLHQARRRMNAMIIAGRLMTEILGDRATTATVDD